MKAEAILIDRPYRQPRTTRALFGLLTLLAWVAWGLLWLPLLTALAWLFGLHTSYVELFVHNHARGWHQVLYLLWLALGCAVVISAWSAYNWWRFHELDRRRGRSMVSMAAMAEGLGVHQSTAIELRSSTRVVLEFAGDGSISHAKAPTLSHESEPDGPR